jgi:hypothetical protein
VLFTSGQNSVTLNVKPSMMTSVSHRWSVLVQVLTWIVQPADTGRGAGAHNLRKIGHLVASVAAVINTRLNE